MQAAFECTIIASQLSNWYIQSIMNINLSKSATKKKSAKVFALGLNARGAAAVTNALAGNSSCSSEEENPVSGREAVNRAIAKEQAVLRARAEAAADLNPIYDYDGAYDSFHPNDGKKEGKKNDSERSRYIGDLLQAAEQRKQERDIAYERKVARDQAAEEEADPEVRGKEKFVTAAYKRKLEERKVWQDQEDKQRKLEEANDLAKRNDGVGMASFYGNLSKNVAMGGGTIEKKSPSDSEKEDPPTAHERGDFHFLDGFARGDEVDIKNGNNSTMQEATFSRLELTRDDSVAAEGSAERRKGMRLLREKKVEEARARYFQRHGITM